MTNDENSPRRGSTPAMIENAIASGMRAIATTRPASVSRVSSRGLLSACRTVGSMWGRAAPSGAGVTAVMADSGG